ncbi:MAG TPA: YqaJ viral recombinase family protein [Ramlibacter sp.]|uniref:YqaJ viral recombinase family nuclease n=1 Tax=Ramlibacter sp. TaxID=1917967 RepID=UPI002D7F0FCD|nr:YqaJ viral recombinase family protein [Ramlibacter sp.]HET8744631.1 YqaJ viral recombinase family protein [Ramlibacter sp.]
MSAVLAPVAQEVDRSKFLGGSDAAAVMGVSPWSTPVELWQEKTGRKRKDPVDPMREKILARGHKLEPFIRDMAIDKLRERGLKVELLAINERYRDPEHDFLACEIDFELRLTGSIVIAGELIELQREHVNVDAKSVTGFARKKWGLEDTEDVPIEYAVQFQHGLMITGRNYCLVAALRSFDDVDLFWTVRDEQTIAGMRAKELDFWVNHVLADVPPDPLTFDDIKALFPLDNGLAAEATEEIAEKVSQFYRIKGQIKEWEDAAEALKFEIAEFISPHSRLTFNGVDICTWKGQNDTRLDQQQLAAAEIYRRADSGEFQRIEDPIGEFSRTKVIRVLRQVKARKK